MSFLFNPVFFVRFSGSQLTTTENECLRVISIRKYKLSLSAVNCMRRAMHGCCKHLRFEFCIEKNENFKNKPVKEIALKPVSEFEEIVASSKLNVFRGHSNNM